MPPPCPTFRPAMPPPPLPVGLLFSLLVTLAARRRLVLSMLPDRVVKALANGQEYLEEFKNVTIMFADIAQVRHLLHLPATACCCLLLPMVHQHHLSRRLPACLPACCCPQYTNISSEAEPIQVWAPCWACL